MSPKALFRDRLDAGRRLGERLKRYRGDDPVVLALPRGGVVVAGEVARALGEPLEVVVARKLSHPKIPGFGVGALAEGGVRIIDDLAVRLLEISDEDLAAAEASQRDALARYLE